MIGADILEKHRVQLCQIKATTYHTYCMVFSS